MVGTAGECHTPQMVDSASFQRTATAHVVQAGYIRQGPHGQHVGSTVGLVRDGDLVLVVDPGLVADRAGLLEAMGALGTFAADVTDVVISHHHPDHTVNIALFPNAKVHDHSAVYDGDLWVSRDAEGVELSPSVRLLRTPGHTPEDISTLVGTADGVVAFTHAWWRSDGPLADPYAPDQAVLDASRKRLRRLVDIIVPGHGQAFPASEAPR